MSICRDVIVIGAAEGGLLALSRLTSSLPAGLPATILVVLHTHRQSLGLLAKLMESYSALPVAYARDGEEVKLAGVYLTPAGFQLVVRTPGALGLEPRSMTHDARPAIDRLFQSAAEVYGPRVIGVVLSGCDGDGTQGMKAIEAAGGIGVVQDPRDAAVPEMPVSALQHNSPHHVASIDEMAKLLVTLTSEKITPPESNRS
jgi:two-component system chemotaxis response regulator CheB